MYDRVPKTTSEFDGLRLHDFLNSTTCNHARNSVRLSNNFQWKIWKSRKRRKDS